MELFRVMRKDVDGRPLCGTGALMLGAAARYRHLLVELLVERKLAGGALAESTEAARKERLDRCWRLLSDREQEEAERWWAAALIGPGQVAALDVSVGHGRDVLPRKAA